MPHPGKVFAIKLVHSFIFVFMVASLTYILYCAIVQRYDWLLLVALAAMAIEGFALLLNNGRCPFTDLARKYGDPEGSVTGLFLPDWFARYTFRVATVVVIIELIWLGVGYFT